ncbi:thymidine kinase [Mycoplasmopsis maculosa]|uniref:Thymidine kinase n=1 Tax=Mycoplasmopsis maculosa TaxID=114885 RepID=A0A449B4T1_9BACT|nr:thymidine kinase [Mycoplasmopsis maculosa]VEU75538.1 thymidine kinase [Mycoplasmopsis maculosa]
MYIQKGNGILEVITGPMFSGKTEELIKRIKILEIAGIKTLVIKPSFDTRYSNSELVSRTGARIKAHNVQNALEIISLYNNRYKAIAIDEVNFMEESLLEVIENLILKGCRVICSGLDMDFLRRPFGIMPKVISIADEVTKLKAVCMKCKKDAGFSFRKIESKELNVLGDDEYEARCRVCHIKGLSI